MEIEPVGRIDHAGHTGAACRQAANEGGYRGMNMNHVKALGAKQFDQPPVGGHVVGAHQITGEPDGLDPDAGVAQTLDQWPVGTDRHHLMAGGDFGDRQGQEKAIEREIDGAELADLHGRARRASRALQSGAWPRAGSRPSSRATMP
jgi:hypothetical protein